MKLVTEEILSTIDIFKKRIFADITELNTFLRLKSIEVDMSSTTKALDESLKIIDFLKLKQSKDEQNIFSSDNLVVVIEGKFIKYLYHNRKDLKVYDFSSSFEMIVSFPEVKKELTELFKSIERFHSINVDSSFRNDTINRLIQEPVIRKEPTVYVSEVDRSQHIPPIESYEEIDPMQELNILHSARTGSPIQPVVNSSQVGNSSKFANFANLSAEDLNKDYTKD